MEIKEKLEKKLNKRGWTLDHLCFDEEINYATNPETKSVLINIDRDSKRDEIEMLEEAIHNLSIGNYNVIDRKTLW